MTLRASRDDDTDTARVCITDHGRWIDPSSHPIVTSRGRGMTLMRALADDFAVDGREVGTTVCLHFSSCSGGDPPEHVRTGCALPI